MRKLQTEMAELKNFIGKMKNSLKSLSSRDNRSWEQKSVKFQDEMQKTFRQ